MEKGKSRLKIEQLLKNNLARINCCFKVLSCRQEVTVECSDREHGHRMQRGVQMEIRFQNFSVCSFPGFHYIPLRWKDLSFYFILISVVNAIQST